ncbi:MAG: bacillithiol biosynthesis deacetylase BshB1 [Sphingobacteriales bacterium]|jgi:bacillithiol biosynthesis deacetylase BshB1
MTEFSKKLDLLVLAAHPDDAELAAGGTILKYVNEGKKVGIVDFTRGELGTRGTVENRFEEASSASKILKLSARENLGLADGFFEHNKENLLPVIYAIRKYKPDVILINAPADRHPDHGKGAKLALDACFLSGLRKIETKSAGVVQDHWRPNAVYHYIQDRFIRPDFVIDISTTFDKKMEAILAFKTQFFNPELKEPQSPISGENFIKYLEARAREMGRFGGVDLGEGFLLTRPALVDDRFSLK